MRTSWDDFLGGAESGHAVEIYADVAELAESVSAYLASGFEAGDPAVVIATREHWDSFAEALARRGWEALELEEEGLLVRADADRTLASFMELGTPSPSAFERVVGGVLDRVAERFPARRIRAFGEMVNILSERGEFAAAVALEELWNELAQSRQFSLLCGYRLDVFDQRTQADALPHVCRTHSHVLPAADPVRMARAVGLALEDVLGSDEADKVYASVAGERASERLPLPQRTLMWVSERMPAAAEKILAAARAHYVRETLASPSS